MSDPDLRRRLVDAVGPVPVWDGADLNRRLSRRRRRRTAGGAVLGLLLLATAVLSLRATLDRPGEPVELAAGSRLEAFDPGREATADTPRMDEEQRRLEPTRAPTGTRRCAGPTPPSPTSATRYCLPDGTSFTLTRGPHDALPEAGDAVPVADRTGFLDRRGDHIELTVSDADSLADTHHRLTTTTDLPPELLADILASIPAVADATPR